MIGFIIGLMEDKGSLLLPDTGCIIAICRPMPGFVKQIVFVREVNICIYMCVCVCVCVLYACVVCVCRVCVCGVYVACACGVCMCVCVCVVCVCCVCVVCVCVCTCVCVRLPSTSLLISSGKIWIPHDWLNNLYGFYMAVVVGILLVGMASESKHII